MTYDYPQTKFSKSIFAGVFAGIVATISNLIYNYIYRDITEYSLSEIINVSSIIFVTIIIFFIAGYLHFILNKFGKTGNIAYFFLFIIITILCIWASMSAQRSGDQHIASAFRGLLMGVIIISGLLATFFIPYLIKNDSILN